MSNREIIEQTVRNNKGIGFRELKRETSLATGVLLHHTYASPNIMQKKKAILLNNTCEECCFRKRCQDTCVLKILRNPTNKIIMKELKEGKKQKDIANKLDLHKSTVSYHCKQLKKFL